MPIPSFQRAQSYIVVWPGDDEITPQFSGEPITLPAMNAIAVPYDDKVPSTRGSHFKFPSAKDRAGNSIPGTVLLTETIGKDSATNGIVTIFDAKQWCEGIFENNKALIDRGLRFVMDPDEVEAAKAEGRPLWEKAEILHAESTIREELGRIEYWKKQGQPAPESSSHAAVMKAKNFLATVRRQQKNAISEEDLLAALGEAPRPAGAPAPAPAYVAPVVEDPKADLAIAARAMRKAAEDGGVNLTKPELIGLIDLDVKVMSAVEAKLEEAGVAVA